MKIFKFVHASGTSPAPAHREHTGPVSAVASPNCALASHGAAGNPNDANRVALSVAMPGPGPLAGPFRFALANEARFLVVALSNDAPAGDDGWLRLAPYGDHPLQRIVMEGGREVLQRFVQRLDKEAAEKMAKGHNGLFGKIRNLRRGAPIFRGHADRWDVAKQEGIEIALKQPKLNALANDKLGIFAQLAAREDGLYGLPVFSDDARTALENEGLKWFSPFWWTDVVSVENGVTVVAPTEFISAALTNKPNILGGHALWNEEQTNEAMKKILIDLLKKAGIALANEEDATVETAAAKLVGVIDARTALENEKTTLSGTVTTLTTERDTAKQALANEQTALANEREAHASTLISLAIAEGRIAPSESDTRKAAFKANFDAAKTALANEKPKFRLQSGLNPEERKQNAGSPDQAHPSTKLVALANEALNKNQFQTFEDAYAGVKTSPEGQKIVAEMKAFDDARKGTSGQ